MISKRAKEMPSFIVMDVLERAKQLEAKGEKIIHLEIGEPAFDTPDAIKRAAKEALEKGYTHYTHSLGLLELREAISRHYYEKYKVDISPDQILVTSGTSPAILLIFSVLLEPGDEIILSNPSYPCYPNIIRYIDGVPIFINVYEEDGFSYQPKAIIPKISKRTKAIMINSPSNPTGQLLSPSKMAEIVSLSPYIISDEIYHGLVYEEKEHTILEFTKNAFVINGFSKLYAMTGWRLGYIIAPKAFIRPMQKVQQNLFISANAFVQIAGITALKETKNDVNRMKKLYNERRKYMIKRLKELGFGIMIEPKGAFYIFANAKKFTNNLYKFAFEMLEKAKVGTTPGIDFGSNGEGYIRFSYASSIEDIKEGMNRIEEFLKTN